MPVSKYRFDNATVEFDGHVLKATFWDGKVNELNLDWCDTPDVRAAAKEMGYWDDWRSYMIEHELTHHWLSDKMCWRWSYSLHEDPRTEEGDKWPEHVAWEEHLVNAVQKEANEVDPDEIDILNKIWGRGLDDVIYEWRCDVPYARRKLLGR